MDFKLDNQETFINLVDKKPVISFYYTDALKVPEPLIAFAVELFVADNTDKEVTLSITAPLANVLNETIDLHQLFDEAPDTFSLEAKEFFDAIKEELKTLLARMENFTYLP